MENIICAIDECGETFYGRYTAQHPAAVKVNNNNKFRSFKSKENIYKNEIGPYRGFSYSSLISDPLNLGKRSQRKTNCYFANFNMAVVSKTGTSRKIPKYFKFV